ncbi:pre-mRNA-splicing factor 18-like isoform X1 [Canna indica]|uniref:Pre-mRNA-splicing factor 18 n=1 Tax=Canna indica TaxID=4628 RepID=A0AAQ3JN08_9LILI|nr:pre-mRNA-splicing factor 18-like isoform X1 [Canna indica]
MDLLKRELQRKRQALQANFGGRKLLRRSEIEHKEIERLRHQEQLLLQCKSQNSSTSSASSKKTSDSPHVDGASNGLAPWVDLSREEVIRRLRILKQPATLFSEDDAARIRRLQAVIESGPIEVEEEMADGQTNDFLRDIYELRRRQNNGILLGRAVDKRESSGDGVEKNVEAGDVQGSDETGALEAEEEVDKDSKRMKGNFEELCDEDKILVFFKRLLSEWGQEVQEMPEAEKRTAKGKFMMATFNQCARYLNPMFKMCRKKTLADDVRQALVKVVQCCSKRDYLAAMDEYIKLAIGNAPWPIGVTMVGIHERSAREKIFTNSIAHIMNDETTRKYLQSVKRLMTFCQRRYPTDPSRSVEFNSLANGSDLQSLLAEERAAKDVPPSQERLRLVSAA